jgi:hypothetical protein
LRSYAIDEFFGVGGGIGVRPFRLVGEEVNNLTADSVGDLDELMQRDALSTALDIYDGGPAQPETSGKAFLSKAGELALASKTGTEAQIHRFNVRHTVNCLGTPHQLSSITNRVSQPRLL